MNLEIEKIGPDRPDESLDKEDIKRSFSDLLSHKYRSLEKFVDCDRLFFIVNDFKRATPTSLILKSIDEYLVDRGLNLFDREVEVIVATGTHEPPTENGLKQILGDYYELLEPKTMIHNCKTDEHVDLGTTERGTPIKVNENILAYDRIIAINSMEPHYFAGFTGGRKSLVPGICHWDTVESNHKFSLADEALPLSLDENPVNLDLVEGTEMIIDFLEGDLIAVNSVATSGEVYGISSGDIFRTFDSLVKRSREVFTSEVSKKADIVIAKTADPATKNLYQSVKSFENCKEICRDGGVLILVSECYEGIGPKIFYEVLCSSDKPKDIREKVHAEYPLGSETAVNILDFLEDHSLYIVSELENETVENCFCESFNSVEKAFNSALEQVGDDPHVVEVDEANNVVPVVKNSKDKKTF
ncbi:MAG: nickel-dependent lactate racemase [Candidatus Saliniplasma sp.]